MRTRGMGSRLGVAGHCARHTRGANSLRPRFYRPSGPLLMPRFSANLGFLFNEVPFLERFGEAAHAGFRAVEFAFAYDTKVDEIAVQAERHKLDVVLINAPPGDWDAVERRDAA